MNSTLKQLFPRGLTLGYGEQLRPRRDWLVLLCITAFLFVVIVGWNIWAFDTAASGGTLGTSATTTPAISGAPSLEAIQKIFDTRAAEELNYQTGAYQFVDPSR